MMMLNPFGVTLAKMRIVESMARHETEVRFITHAAPEVTPPPCRCARELWSTLPMTHGLMHTLGVTVDQVAPTPEPDTVPHQSDADFLRSLGIA